MRKLCILLALTFAGCDRPDASGPAGAGPRRIHAFSDAPRPAPVKPFAMPAPDVVLLITGGTHGRLEVCNCPGPAAGGLTRRSGMAISYRHAYPHVFLIDTGDFFWIEPADPRNDYLLRGYRTIGYDAVVLGDHEWGALAGSLGRNLAAAPMNYLSTSATPAKVKLPVVPAVVRDFGKVKLAVISYLGPGTMGFLSGLVPKELVLAGVDAVAKQAARLKADGCVVVLAAHVGQSELAQLKDINHVDLILQGNTTRSEEKVGRLGRVPVVKVGGPDHVGVVALKVEGRRIRALEYRLEVINLHWPEDQRLMNIFQAYAHEAMRRSFDAQRGGSPKVVPSASCGRCHEAQYKAWGQGRHKRAWETLARAGRTRQGDCLMCHTSGYKTAQGFRTIAATPKLAGVNCQDCHRGNLDPHAGNPSKHRPPVVSQDVCTLCHTPGTSPDFNFARYRKRVGCVRAKAGRR